MDFRNYKGTVSKGSARTSSYAADNTQIDQGLRAYMLKIYNYMAIAMLITGIVAYGASTSTQFLNLLHASALKWVIIFAPLAIVFYLSARINKMSTTQAQGWLWAFSAMIGLSLSSLFVIYTGESIASTFFVTAAGFAALSLYGYTTKKDLSGMASFLIIGLVGIIIASLANLYFQSPAVTFAVSIIGVLVFAGLTAYDTQRVKENYYNFGANPNIAVMGALSLYLDFINLFVFLLQLLGDRR